MLTVKRQQSLKKYIIDIQNRLDSPTPEKWAHSPDSYRRFLERELKLAKYTLETAELEQVKK